MLIIIATVSEPYKNSKGEPTPVCILWNSLSADWQPRPSTALAYLSADNKHPEDFSAEIEAAQQLDKPLITVGPEFFNTCGMFLQNLLKFKFIKGFHKELVQEENVINRIHAMADGGVPGYSFIIYSEIVSKKQTSRVCRTK